MSRRKFTVFAVLPVVPLWLVSGGQVVQAADAPGVVQVVAETVRLNQLGYLPDSQKRAYIAASAVEGLVPSRAEDGTEAVSAPEVKVRRVGEGGPSAVVWTGRAAGPVQDPLSGESIFIVDFSGLTSPGRYVVQAGEGLASPPFEIGTGFLSPLFVTVTRSYYLQRCGIEVNDPVSGIAHGICHQLDGLLRHSDPFGEAGSRVDVRGGWHDAGDYGKYSTTTAVTVGQLLLLYQLFPSAFPDGQLAIPESGNGTPDLLDEARVGLEWLLKMQRVDGAVYHKLGPDRWPGMILPEKDRARRYVYGVTSQDTAKAAAVWAMGARLFRPFDTAFADRLLQAATRAWQFLVEHPETVDGARPGDDAGSGGYRDASDADDRFWAAAELYAATGDPSFARFVGLIFRMSDVDVREVSWTDASAIGIIDLVMGQMASTNAAADPTGDLIEYEVADLREKLRQLILERADEMVSKARLNPYGLLLEAGDFVWASNKTALARAMLLLVAEYLDPVAARSLRLDVATRQLDWVLGANPLGKSFVTGIGTNPVLHPHHRLSEALGRPVPGLLVGGPNSRAEDNIAP
ncbi:MAG: glycoside hydrolase family 9 protein, partial [Bacteroidota bacterium]